MEMLLMNGGVEDMTLKSKIADSYSDKETIIVSLTVEIEYKRGSTTSRQNAIRLATEHHLNAGGVCLDGCYHANSVKSEVLE